MASSVCLFTINNENKKNKAGQESLPLNFLGTILQRRQEKKDLAGCSFRRELKWQKIDKILLPLNHAAREQQS